MNHHAPTIDRLTPAARGSAWVWVVADGKREVRVPGAVAKSCGLKPGVRLDDRLRTGIAAHTGAWLAERDGVRLLRARGRSRTDLRERLLARGHAPAHIAAALDRLTAAGALNDDALAAAALDRLTQKQGASTAMKRRRLASLKIAPDAARTALARDNADDQAEARRIASRAAERLGPETPAPAAVRRLLGILSRRGFDEETSTHAVASALPRLWQRAQEP